MEVGTVISLPDPVLAEMAGAVLDFAWIDLEHGALGTGDVPALAIALAAAGCEAHVRLAGSGTDALSAVLDSGVDGIVAPGVESAAQARALVRRLRYPPAGDRGYGPRRAGGYGRAPRYWEAARVRCTVQIESPAGVAAAGEIAAVDGVDTVVLGCGDLSIALDVPQDLTSPALREAADRVAEACARAGVRFGIAAVGDPAELQALAGGRAALLLYSADIRLYASGVDAALRSLEELHARA
jgi:4-hydroxy-2-oxoheptanedioate aldolase